MKLKGGAIVEVGELISFFRKQSGMTIDELSAKSGVPKGTLNKIIGGVTKAPTLDNMKSIAKALGKTLADFDDEPITAEKIPGGAGSGAEDEPGDDLRAVLIRNFDQLHQEGPERLVETSDDMVNSGKYIKTDKNQLGKAQGA